MKADMVAVAGVAVLALTAVEDVKAVNPVNGNDIAVQVSAVAQAVPAQITLQWPNSPSANIVYDSYAIYRKAASDSSWGAVRATLPGTATNFVDTNVSVGAAYEYQVIRNGSDHTTTPPPVFSGYGYVCSGIQAPLVESRGKMILLVDATVAPSLSNELAVLQQDLAGDGWTVLRQDVGRGATVGLTGDPQVVTVKGIIQSYFTNDPANVKGLFLLGHIPVPYAGNIAPDGHSDHQGAWPADMYYGDMTGTWTDNSVNITSASQTANRNTPGDGKWDQSNLPANGAVALQMGRVDFYNLPQFVTSAAKDETALLRQYLNKDHAYRHKLSPFTAVRRRTFYADNGTALGRTYSQCFRNADPLFGPASLDRGTWTTALTTNPPAGYWWAYGLGEGSYTGVAGVITTQQAATMDLQVVFSMLSGSYSGDWNSQDNVMRGMLGTASYCLSCAWGSGPTWYYHPMALGATLGECARLTQNNRTGGLYPNPFATAFSDQALAMVHTAQLGDPSLRMFPVAPPQNVSVATNENTVSLSWTASPDVNAAGGYHVYRASSATGPFSRVDHAGLDTFVTGTNYSEASLGVGTHYYMVRAVRLETSGSGSYFNPSQGAWATLQPRMRVKRQGSEIELSWDSLAKETYQVEYTSALTNGQWNVLQWVAGDGTTKQVCDSMAQGDRGRFYRLAVTNGVAGF
ncbi:MAG: fibronectin type III domain-containing protein [Verrucomicrobia bacterium]|nr:fibronectin type III domain-containing protein [Verrucomicrobiota bacterium]